MKVIHVEEGQSIGDALAQAGAPDAVIDLVSAIMGEQPEPQPCDCRPGVCLAEADEFADTDDDFEVEFEPDFELSQEPDPDHVEAVANLGRVLEGLTQLAHIQSRLVSELFGG